MGKQQSTYIFILMKSTLSEASKPVLVRKGSVQSVWLKHGDAMDAKDFAIDKEISKTGRQDNGYWVEARVAWARKNESHA